MAALAAALMIIAAGRRGLTGWQFDPYRAARTGGDLKTG
jgi:hypothetical protein